MKFILKWLNILDVSSEKAIKLPVQQVHIGKSRIISAENYLSISDKVAYGRSELYYHADTTVTGGNCCILQYTGNSVMYHHIVTTMKLSKAYQYNMQKLFGSH